MGEEGGKKGLVLIITVGLLCTFVFFGVGFGVGYAVFNDDDNDSKTVVVQEEAPTPQRVYAPYAAIDTHTHTWIDCYNADLSSGVPNSSETSCSPAPRRYTPEGILPNHQLLGEWFRNGMNRGVITAVSFMGTSNQYMLDQVSENVRVTVAITDSDGYVDVTGSNFRFPEDLTNWHENYYVRSFRLNYKNKEGEVLDALLKAMDPESDITSMTALELERWNNFQTLFAFVRENNWYVDVQHESVFWAQLMPVLLKQECNIIVDHFGRPALDWRNDIGFEAILDSANTERVWVKVSGSYRLKTQDKEDQRDLARTVRDAFGVGRLLWGSDYPYTGCHATFEDAKAAQHCEDSQNYESLLNTLNYWYEKDEVPIILNDNAATVFEFNLGKGAINLMSKNNRNVDGEYDC